MLDWAFFTAVTVFIAAYAIIVSERIHRTSVALAGGISLLLLGVLTQKQAIEAIDFNTIGLLVGMMIIVSITKKTGLFQYVAVRSAQLAKGEPLRILILLALITALFSSVLDNVTTILLVGPVTFVVAQNLKVNPIPFLVAEIMMANLGGAMTLVGDPVNILIGSAAELSFTDFLFNTAPVVVVLMPIVILILKLKYKTQLVATEERKQSIMKLNPKSTIQDVTLLKKSLFVIGLVVLGFLLHGVVNFEPATLALSGAAILLVISGLHPEQVLEDLEWTTILFFVGLFVLVAGLEVVGVIDRLAMLLLDATNGSVNATVFSVFLGAGLLSGVVDNVPFVATMIPLVQELGMSGIPINPLWWSLALGAILGGNATLIGASTNLVGAGLAERAGHKMNFIEFFKTGALVLVISLIITGAYIWVRYL